MPTGLKARSALRRVQGRYSPAECIGADKRRVEGNPDPKHVFVCRASDLTMRMQMRRFTRLTSAFSKKV
jgi:hypothetical protein